MPVLLKINALKKAPLLTILFCFSTFVSFTQSFTAADKLTISVKGVVFDSATQAVLSHVTVEATEVGSNHVLKSTLTNESGLFELTSLPQKQLKLTFTYTGYRPVIKQLSSIPSAVISLGHIPLVSLSQQLEEVQVTSQKPILEQILDRLIYNVDADPESKTASALDLLRKIPLVWIDADDNIQLNGNSSYRILVNGKSSSLFSTNQSEILRNLAGSAIKTIEVITVPPSKYEAEGVGGILNIITYKRTLAGYNGGINTRVSTPKGTSVNGNLTMNVGKFGLSGLFGHSSNTSPVARNSLLRQDKISKTRLKQRGYSNFYNESQNGGGEISYELNQLNVITIDFHSNRGSSKSDYQQEVTLLNALGEPAEAYRRLNMGWNEQHGSDLSMDYQRNFKKNEARQLSLSYKRSQSNNNNSGYLTLQPQTSYQATSSLTENNEGFSEQVLKADYSQPLKKHTLELGINATQRQNSSDYFYKDHDSATGAFRLNLAQSNSFDYQEEIYAGYASLNLKTGKWGLLAGARLEEAEVNAHFITSSTATRQKYINLVPNIAVTRQLKGASTLRLSYTQRMQRPSLYYLNPYIDRADPWNISYGNPQLQPTRAQVFNLGYNTFFKKTSINLNVFHQFTNNAVQQFTVLGNDSITHTTFGNIGRFQNTSLSLGFNSTLFRKWDVSLNGNANHLEYSIIIRGKTQKRQGLSYNTSGTANFRLNTWRISSSLNYTAPNIQIQGKTAGYISNSATLNKYFLKNNQAGISLSVSSPFRERRRSYTEIDGPAFYLLRSSYTVIRRFNLSLNYRFVKVQGK